MDNIIIAHDMGTSGDKAIALTVKGQILAEVKRHYPIHHPQPTWAEQNPDDWWEAICANTKDLLDKAGIQPQQVAGITFSSMTQCIVAVDTEGKPLRPAISWLDGRSADIIREKLWTPPRLLGYNIPRAIKFIAITGGAPGHTGKDQIGKLLWLRENEPDVFSKTWKFLDAKDYITYKLTGKTVTSTDLAHIWWMMDTRKKRHTWHPGLCELAGIRPDQLSEIRPSNSIAGKLTPKAAEATGLLPGTPVLNGSGDLAAAALGSGAHNDGDIHICVGTSGWAAAHVTKRKIDLPHYTGCIGSAWPDKYYLAMAHQETCGICLEWLKDHVLYHKGLLLEEFHASEIYEIFDDLAETVEPGAKGLVFTPWMYGERCPLDDEHVRAGLHNLSLHHSREHIVRAVFEGIALNMRWALETLENLYDKRRSINIIGGGGRSDIWCQIFADITGHTIRRVNSPQQANARGIALLASLTLGYLDSFEDIAKHIEIDKVFTPNAEHHHFYNERFKAFKDLYKRNKGWFKKQNR
ncbi:FGGY-family carbohydrate kinase [bacterium]|nr:FGGY-family carbohydrate kinase [bacterium]